MAAVMSKYYYVIIGIMISTLSHMILDTKDFNFGSKGSLVSIIIASILWVVVLREESKK